MNDDPGATRILTECPAPDDLNRFQSADLPPERLESIAVHASTCRQCGSTLEQLNTNSTADFSGWLQKTADLEDYPAEEQIKELERRIVHQPDRSMPEQIGSFFILRQLGQGGFATVYEAADDAGNRVAIKTPRADRIFTRDQEEAFLAEARTALTLKHPHILPVHSFGRDDSGRCFLVMDLVEGNALSKANPDNLSTRDKTRILSQTAEALKYIHARGLIHRDVKPDNILIGNHGEALLTDFGLTQQRELQSEDRNQLAGTIKYMSPEQLQGKADVLDGRSDVWSLGVVMHMLFMREAPFVGTDTLELRDEIERRPVRPLRESRPDVPAWLDTLCRKCLERDPRDRPDTMGDVLEALQTPQKVIRKRIRNTCMGIAAATILLFLAVSSGNIRETIQLLSSKDGQPPKTRSVIVEKPNGTYSYDALAESATLSGRHIETFGVCGKNFDVRFDIQKDPISDKAECGFFWGLTAYERVSLLGKKRPALRMGAVFLVWSDEPVHGHGDHWNDRMARFHEWQVDARDGASLFSGAFGSWDTPDLQSYSVEVKVREGAFESLSVNGNQIGTAEDMRVTPNYRELVGQEFGLVSQRGMCRITNFEITELDP